MKVGIDGDILAYELGAVAMEKDECFGFVVERPWPKADVEKAVDDRINVIKKATGTLEFEVYLTGDGNFRFDIATIATYKGNRVGLDKPHHWSTVRDILTEKYGALTVCGIEADDALGLMGAKYGPEKYTIASRDKDLRMVPCRHYSWACGEKQPEIGPYVVDGIGEISIKKSPSGGSKLLGNGIKFFYGQMLTGDSVDNIKGCPKVGPVKAYKLLGGLTTEEECYQVVAAQYHAVYGDEWERYLVENGRLLWMIQDLSWVDIKREGQVLQFTIKQMWEPTFDYNGYELPSEGSVHTGDSPEPTCGGVSLCDCRGVPEGSVPVECTPEGCGRVDSTTTVSPSVTEGPSSTEDLPTIQPDSTIPTS